MNLLKSKHWVAIAIGILSGPALAADIECPITPAYSVITEGQTLQLTATCDGALASVEWSMADGMPATSLTGVVDLNGHSAGKPISFTTPVGLGGTNEFTFTLSGTPASEADSFTGSSAIVVVKPSSAAIARAQGLSDPTTPVDAACGTASGGSAQSMPTGTAQCATGSKAALPITGSQSFTWSCVSLTGGAEASCYAMRGYTVTTQAGANGTVSASQGVAANGEATITAYPAPNYSASFATGTTCPGTPSDNTFKAGPIVNDCIVKATFTNSPTAAVCGSANGVATLTTPSTGLCQTGTLLGSVASGTGQFTWTCDGPNGGQDASCMAPKQYTVTATVSGTGGSVNAPASKTVTHGASTTFGVTPEGTNVASASGSSNCSSASASGTTVGTGAVTGTCDVTVTFGPAVTGIIANGVTMPGTVKEVTTALPSSPFAKYTANPVNGDEVFSFKMTVPATGQSVRTLSTTKMTAMVGQKRMTISEYRGDYDTTGKLPGCTGVGVEVVSLTTVVNYPTASTTKYCHLTPGKTYWVNVSSRFNKDYAPTCSTSSNCGFYFQSN